MNVKTLLPFALAAGALYWFTREDPYDKPAHQPTQTELPPVDTVKETDLPAVLQRQADDYFNFLTPEGQEMLRPALPQVQAISERIIALF